MTVALYATIWSALALLVVAELSRRRAGAELTRGWAWRAYAAGAVLCLAHFALAFHVRHGWSHAVARVDIARQTEELFGLRWAGGVYVNYVFAASWLLEALWWRLGPGGYARRPRALVWLVRAFWLVVIFNGAIVFASPVGRLAGAPLVGALSWIWLSPMRWERGLVQHGTSHES